MTTYNPAMLRSLIHALEVERAELDSWLQDLLAMEERGFDFEDNVVATEAHIEELADQIDQLTDLIVE